MSTARRSSRRVVVRESKGSKTFEQSRLRLLCVSFFFLLCYGSLCARLVEMMVKLPAPSVRITVSDFSEDGETSEQVEIDSERRVVTRGDIVDRNGSLLATSLITESLFANPREVREPEKVASLITRTLPNVDKSRLLANLKSNRTFVWIKRNLTPTEQQAVNDLGIPGLYFLPEERRVYPEANVLAHVLGYVGVDGKGLSGIEKTMDERLLRQDITKPLQLSIDLRVQHIVHDELAKAVKEFKALGGTGLVLDIQTGELISMVSLPDFDPHKPGKAKSYERFNRASLGTYEMGSTFKSFTAAMALDTGATSMTGEYDATQPLKVASYTIDDSHPKRRWLSVPEIYAYSSNIGTARMALACGIRRQKQFMEKLGMLSPLDIELPEIATPQYPSDWKEINMITISYGHGISVTPLHLVRGIASMVNGGTLPKLTLVKNANDGRVRGERVISEETSRNMRRLMRMVVKYGTGGKANVVGYRVAGKTGTAEKVGAHGYNHSAKMALFVSAFPVDDPRYAILVMVDEPQGNKSTYGYATGGWISAPVVGHIVERMAPLVGVRPVFNSPADDAEQFWVSTEKPSGTIQAKRNQAKDLVHAVSYTAR